MKHIAYITGCIFSALLLSCQSEDNILPPPAHSPEKALERSISTGRQTHEIPGVLFIKIAKEHSKRIHLSTNGDVAMHTVPSGLSSALNSIGTTKMTPLFPIDPRWEKRMRTSGLDEWYQVEISSEQDLTEAVSMLSHLSEVSVVEKDYATTLPGVKVTPVPGPLATESTTGQFNDPGLALQWHYQNDGKFEKSVAGADINLFKAWQYETGKADVIVAVTDGGIDTTHEDLIDNLWTNPNEIPGNGIDDDNNGYVDDVHGVNFIHLNGEIYPDADSHGTHVAGTVSARNNNGIGVCGVAGGDGSPESGVRLMSCQKFGRRGEASRGSQSAQAFVYAANNGAVISQNSWGYTYPGPGFLPAYEKEAIDYFIQHAGCDNDGNQLEDAPMKGGVVIFAAGNDGQDYLAYPAAYNKVVAVSSMAPDWKKAYYSNRGAWVDIMAPGGDQRYAKGEVYSTLAPSVKNAKYGYMQGTSMACPHVSGVAALIVSKYGKKGFTNEELKARLLGSLRPMNINVMNQGFEDRLGIGYIDAEAAFAKNENIPPQKVDRVSVMPEFITVTLNWIAVEDADDRMALFYNLYMDEKELNSKNYTTARQSVTVKSFGVEPGREMSSLFEGLTDNKDYFFAIEAVDRWGLRSIPSFVQARTKKNTPPSIEGLPDKKIRVTGAEKFKFTVTMKDGDGHQVHVKISGDKKGVTYKIEKNKVHFVIMATAPVGQYKIKVEGRDEIGATVDTEIPFEIYAYKPPVFRNNVKPQIVGQKQGEKHLDVSALLDKDPAQKVTYQVSSSDGSILSAKINDEGQISLLGRKNGRCKVNVVVTDGVSAPASTSFEVRVVDDRDALVYTMYPVPVEKQLNVIVNPELLKASFEVISMMGRVVYQKDYDINGQNNIILGLAQLTPGSYTLKVSSDKGVYQKNFVKL